MVVKTKKTSEVIEEKAKKNKDLIIEVVEGKTKLVVADIGSFNIKLSEAQDGETYENRFVIDNECGQDAAEKLIYNDNVYVFGKGKFDLTFGKAFKNFEVPLLYAMGKNNVIGSINLILHLPSNQMSNKQILVDKLQGKTFKYTVNDNVNQSVTFKTVGVLKEGFSSFYALAKRNKGMIAIVDIGGRTTDVFLFIDGVLVKELSIPNGTMNYFRKIADTLTNSTGELYEVEDINPLIKNNSLDLGEHEEETNEIFTSIKNDMKALGSLKGYAMHLCGGGSEFFFENFKNEYKNVVMMDKNLISNVIGAENIGKAKGLDK